MSVDRLLQKYSDESLDADNVDDQGCFGLLRGQRDRALMVELRKKDGVVLAIPYAMIEHVRYSPDEGITIRIAGRDVRISGRHLHSDQRPSLVNGLSRHRVAWISEPLRSAALTAEAAATVVESISW